ncbi:lysylphosphatidylglycerol synthase domain-containing protein [Lacinutrix venerupis]|uniref:Lysylphosphatidylglycerol synthase-like protein n=1 Tax=Lacinutrix venerupis TaxID=1486034 RepID=A0AAC9PWB2_9FLAO|nr:lysylphosphatidylglycerol synthase domain-containing protein [Lacinutrix venerupis]APX99303.1 hypothetical protein BWR22_02925 [Lacinutrix venerupis]
MHNGLSYKTKQFFFVLIKLSIVVGAFYFIYNKLVNNNKLDFYEFATYLNSNNVLTAKNVILLMFLSFLNWYLEILKWQSLVSFIKKISFFEALKQSLGALTASLFTPNRIGEYGAKAIYFAKQYRKKILLLNLTGNTIQMVITVIFGGIGFYLFSLRYPIEIDSYRVLRFAILLLVIFSLSIFGLQQKKYKSNFFSISKLKHFFRKIPFRISVNTFLLSLFRYFVFSYQFYFLLSLFGVGLSYFEAMIIITSMYLLSSIIPSVFIFDVVIKGSVAVYLFSFAGIDEFTVLCAITLMWILNFVFPSIFGSYFVLNFNFNKQNKSA